jgi:cytochrome c553
MSGPKTFAAFFLSSLAAGAGAMGAEPEAIAPSLARNIQACSTCHGDHGRSIAPTFPNLAAQSAPYLEAQLKAFKDQTRADPDAQAYMWGMASQLSDSDIADLARYFARQPAAVGRAGDAALLERGKRVFEEGIPAQHIPACAACHGPRAEGAAAFPRLADQHAPYILKQLLVIQNALRNAPVMHGVVKDLTREQMLAVATYLQSI